MNEPKRWLDDESAPAGVHDLLRASARARPIDQSAKLRVGKSVARLSVVPVSIAAWLGTKSALAALGAAAGVATMGVVTLVTRTEPPARPPAPAVKPVQRSRTPELAPRPTVSAAPSAVASTGVARAPQAPTAVFPNLEERPAGLAEETAFLERARRALGADPAFALLLVREHGTRFPRGQLGAERTLIEIEALERSGRHAEARALAEQTLASGRGDLYAERVRALLERLERER
jgi:hypothetical protein